MSTTIEDPIVAEVHAAREAIFASCDYDHAKFAAHMREYAGQLKREGWVFSDRPIVHRQETTSYSEAPTESFVVREEPPLSTEN